MGLKGGGTEKRGEETRFLKRGEANLGQGVVTLKKGGGLESFYELCFAENYQFSIQDETGISLELFPVYLIFHCDIL